VFIRGFKVAMRPPVPVDSDESSDDGEWPEDTGLNLYHPSNAINQYRLDTVPGALVGVTHDDEWASVLKEADNGVPEVRELIRRMSSTISHNDENKMRDLEVKTSGGLSDSHRSNYVSEDMSMLADRVYVADDGIAWHLQPTIHDVIISLAGMLEDLKHAQISASLSADVTGMGRSSSCQDAIATCAEAPSEHGAYVQHIVRAGPWGPM